MCVWGGEWGEREGERERGEREREREKERGGERENEWSNAKCERFFFSPLILFHVMDLLLRRRKGTDKNTLLLLSLLLFYVEDTGKWLIRVESSPSKTFDKGLGRRKSRTA